MRTTLACLVSIASLLLLANPLRAANTPIHAIQGSGALSSLVNSIVTTTGIVTALKSNGFFLQTGEAESDDDVRTSQGIFVFTSSAPPAAAQVGNSVSVTGRVIEFVPSSAPQSLPLTEIGGAPAMTLLSTGHSLPPARELTRDVVHPAMAPDELENLEGMRVRVAFLRVVAPTGGSVAETAAVATSNGVFYGVLDGTPRPFREPGIPRSLVLPASAPCCIPRFDENPERLRVDSDAQPGSPALNVSSGALVGNLVGPLDYGFGSWTILPDPGTATALSLQPIARDVMAPLSEEFSVASMNLQRFFDDADDPAFSEPILTTAAFQRRLQKASLVVRTILRLPDIIGVQEVENVGPLRRLADAINADVAASPGGVDPRYTAFVVPGNDPGGINVGFLVRQSRVRIISVTQEGKDATFVDPTDLQREVLNDRPPLVLRALIETPAQLFPITLIVNHLRSLTGIEDQRDGPRVRAKRRAQAEWLARLIDDRQVADPAEALVLVGDFNAFEFNDGFVDVIGTIVGNPAPGDQLLLPSSDLVTRNLASLVDTLPPQERYSYVHDGNAQLLDHVLVNAVLLGRFRRIAYARSNADFAETLRNEPDRPERLSDHDMPVAFFALSDGPTSRKRGVRRAGVNAGAEGGLSDFAFLPVR